MDTMGRLTVGIDCDNCGITRGVPAGDGVNRCTECGRFASDEADVCCLKHEVRSSPYSTGECPYCEQERHARDMEREMHQRRADPNMHPSIDAPRR